MINPITNNRCLPPETLRQFLANELTEEFEASVLTHLETCPSCQELCDSVAGGDQIREVRSKLVRLEREGEATAVSALRNELYAIDDTVSQPGRPDDTHTQAHSSATSSPGELPREFGGYELLEEIARGGMGIVYKARHLALDRLVALKMIRARHATAEDLTRFHIEAEAAARLQHPNVVQIYEFGDSGGQPFLALEFCSGGSLASKLKGTPLPRDLSRRWPGPLTPPTSRASSIAI
jgi:hypothetical protein